MRAYRYLDFITALFVVVLIVSNIASTKVVLLGPFTFDGGTILFPLAYIFGDVLTEVYGYKRSRRVIWTGFLLLTLATLTFGLVNALPTPPDQQNTARAFSTVLGLVPRIALASLVAYWVGEFVNSYVLAKLKIATQGRWLWTRTLGSTLIGQAFDTGLFLLIAFYGVWDDTLLRTVFVSNYVFKVGVEALFTPLTYAVVGFLKRTEGEDYYDRNTNFNPFAVR
ncbi:MULTISPECIES: queuosine precursor transporter [unclassified Meiothermus]|uniref:queuosine precursor transporter n=1 Tax=unclassified Meiothermus TaxID=370471 RepID=UPI000D7C4471|nr:MULTISPECIES: queuosine precursor transporter [unclassified Meiothermus]PZA07085.1 VUT family protein [Meiothermus sp. Pnk-1]RYM40035.1 VUT family protein [Meiothermus sp. PNK-Is4]